MTNTEKGNIYSIKLNPELSFCGPLSYMKDKYSVFDTYTYEYYRSCIFSSFCPGAIFYDQLRLNNIPYKIMYGFLNLKSVTYKKEIVEFRYSETVEIEPKRSTILPSLFSISKGSAYLQNKLLSLRIRDKNLGILLKAQDTFEKRFRNLGYDEQLHVIDKYTEYRKKGVTDSLLRYMERRFLDEKERADKDIRDEKERADKDIRDEKAWAYKNIKDEKKRAYSKLSGFKIEFATLNNSRSAYGYLKRMNERIEILKKELEEDVAAFPVRSGAVVLDPETFKSYRKLSINEFQEGEFLNQIQGPIPSYLSDEHECELVRVIDGDTVKIRVIKTQEEFTVRVMGFNCPELNKTKKYQKPEIFSREATDRLGELLSTGTISIKLDDRGLSYKKGAWVHDRYGRLLAHIYTDGIPVGKFILEEGLAECVTSFPIESSIMQGFLKAEAVAKSNNLNIWESWKAPKNKGILKTLSLVESIQVTEDAYEEGMVSELLKNFLVKSKNSLKIHKTSCRYSRRILDNNKIDYSLNKSFIKKASICKVCGGEPWVTELIEEYMREKSN